MRLAIITARGGSKRIPKKNIKEAMNLLAMNPQIDTVLPVVNFSYSV